MATPITTSSSRASGSSTKTFRITGVPNGWDKEELRSFMGNYFQDVSIQSLAPRIDGGSGQATAILGDQVRDANPSGTSTIGGLTWDTDFVGMTTLFAPPQDDHKLDIIAVSGLGGHAFGSFKERGGSHMWLRDSLPYEILDKVTKRPMARVIIYGHRSDVAHSTTIQGFPDISASLLHSLRPLAAETPTTPIMFIGHSLGGILIKQALVCIAASETQHDTLGRLLRATRAIIFFAVPHSGMRIEALTEMADPSSNGPLISSLSCENSPALQTLRDEFKKLCDKKQNSLGDCRFFCFYETERSSTAAQDHMGKWRMIGPKVLAVSTVSARYCPQSESDDLCVCDIQRSHSDIVKFGQNDSEYDKVRSVLRDMARHTILTRANVTLDERAGECLRALWFKDMNKRFTEVEKAVEGTDEPAESLLLMQWICFAQDVMTVRQLRWAIVIDVERPGVDDPEKSLNDYFNDDAYIGDDEDMERRIVVLSCGLAEVVAGRVQFIHQAVKEFFLGRGLALLRSNTMSENRSTIVATDEQKSGHYRLARTCILCFRMVQRFSPSGRVDREELIAGKYLVQGVSPSTLFACTDSRPDPF
ncbi:hypothetical protein ACQRIU_006492 [Beauveria bassiana]